MLKHCKNYVYTYNKNLDLDSNAQSFRTYMIVLKMG